MSTVLHGMAEVYKASPAKGTSINVRYLSIKRLLDLVLATLMLLLTAPFILISMLLVRLTSRGPMIYAQKRLGQEGRTFTIYKIRTMYHNCEVLTGPRWASARDPRVTPVGRFLRATHLDELPQLWNVLRGDMSLVGPRPERPEFIPALEQDIPHYRQRLEVRPGLTGLAQVQLPADTDLDSVRRKLAHDLYYIERLGPWLDLRLLAGTALYALGLPFSVAARLLRVPHGEEVEGEGRAAEDARCAA